MEGTIESELCLEAEAGEILWAELERHFARGVVIVVASDMDLIEVAKAFSEDDAETLRNWLQQERVSKAEDDHARRWSSAPVLLRAIVVAPWVLVQEPKIH